MRSIFVESCFTGPISDEKLSSKAVSVRFHTWLTRSTARAFFINSQSFLYQQPELPLSTARASFINSQCSFINSQCSFFRGNCFRGNDRNASSQRSPVRRVYLLDPSGPASRNIRLDWRFAMPTDGFLSGYLIAVSGVIIVAESIG